MKIEKEDIEYLISKKLKDYEKQFGKDFKFALIELVGLEKQLLPTNSNEEKEFDRLIPLVEWNKYHPYPTIKSLRMKIFNNQNNFEDEVIERDGKRILINERKYFEWHKKYNLENA